MRTIGAALALVGVVGMLLASMLAGDAVIAAMIASGTALLSGLGFVLCAKKMDDR